MGMAELRAPFSSLAAAVGMLDRHLLRRESLLELFLLVSPFPIWPRCSFDQRQRWLP